MKNQITIEVLLGVLNYTFVINVISTQPDVFEINVSGAHMDPQQHVNFTDIMDCLDLIYTKYLENVKVIPHPKWNDLVVQCETAIEEGCEHLRIQVVHEFLIIK
jgi:hypothetical protein